MRVLVIAGYFLLLGITAYTTAVIVKKIHEEISQELSTWAVS